MASGAVYTCVLAHGERHEGLGLCEALEVIRAVWPEAYFQGDGARVLAWPDAATSIGDDGRHAVASIFPVGSFADRVSHYADTIARDMAVLS